MPYLPTETIIALVALLFCLPQLVLSTLSWYEARRARLCANRGPETFEFDFNCLLLAIPQRVQLQVNHDVPPPP
ncbi:hypothetical protein F4677DRAFT_441541 [Hypoxylon crocopeplum]|nr:hypothetical protein F4677DRAFT_441541 [Hypoxylon crocopeplum]